ncbi:MAG: DUF3488 domain-containing protein, partial [Myxococcales bacterium]|nr:DUF3488 domain-containing protein [Myxococcales bacterium]
SLYLYVGERDAIGGFGPFLLLAAMVVLAGARTRAEHKVTYLLALILLMAVGHRTLEIFYLAPVVGFFACYAWARMGDEVTAGSPALPRGRATLLLMGASVALAVPIFLVMPRTRMSVMALTSRASLSGFGGAIAFGEMGPLKLSNRLVMKVHTSEPRLLRGSTLNEYTRSGWKNTTKGSKQMAGRAIPLLEAEREEVGPGLRVDTTTATLDVEGRPRAGEDVLVQEVLLEPFEEAYLFGAHKVLAVWAPGQHLAATTAGDVIRVEHDSRNEKLAYTVYSDGRRPDAATLRSARPFRKTGRFRERYLQLPDDLPPEVTAEATRLVGELPGIDAKAERLVRFFAEEFDYSLERRTDPNADPVADFLFGDRRGHCEYFATAMAVMLRTQGVFTRVVVGFAPGDFNRYAEAYTVRDRDAHAWVEVFFGDDVGWVEYDPTPPDDDHAVGEEEGSDLYLWMTAKLDGLDAWWQNEVVNYYYNEDGPQTESWLVRLDEFLMNEVGLRQLFNRPDEFARKAGRYLALALAGGLLLGFGTWAVRHDWGLHGGGFETLLARLLEWLRGFFAEGAPQLASPPRRGPAARLYRRARAALGRRGLELRESWTPAETLRRVREHAPELAAAFANAAYEYGGAGAYTGTEPDAPNATLDPAGAKWSRWAGYDENRDNISAVGAYEGAQGRDTGIYRPTDASKMGAQTGNATLRFNAVVREALILSFYQAVPLILDHEPNDQPLTDPEVLWLQPIDRDHTTVEWTVGSTVATGQTDVALGVVAWAALNGVGAGTYTVTARVTDPSNWVRVEPRVGMEDSVSWQVTLTR